nr:dihydropteroate synthase [Candidatus Rhodobacter lobularis]
MNTRGKDGLWEYPLAVELPEDLRARLSDRRADICGLPLDRPRVMGIVNVTPDSFSDGGDRFTVAAALEAVRGMEGADILDIGGESTRPGADFVPEADEIARVVPVIEAIRAAGVSTPISIDTRKASVAAAALDAGADLVNDVSAMSFDSAMAGLVAERDVPICLMHALGDPKTMQDDPRYDDVVLDVYDYLAGRIEVAQAAGIKPARIIADPGIGFGKTLEHNLAILQSLSLYHGLGVPLLLGASRKRFIGTLGGASQAKVRMPGSLAVGLHGAAQGAHILRVHDVAETVQALQLWQAMTG